MNRNPFVHDANIFALEAVIGLTASVAQKMPPDHASQTLAIEINNEAFQEWRMLSGRDPETSGMFLLLRNR